MMHVKSHAAGSMPHPIQTGSFVIGPRVNVIMAISIPVKAPSEALMRWDGRAALVWGRLWYFDLSLDPAQIPRVLGDRHTLWSANVDHLHCVHLRGLSSFLSQWICAASSTHSLYMAAVAVCTVHGSPSVLQAIWKWQRLHAGLSFLF